MYTIECKEKGDEGFEDQLTAGFQYAVIERGVNGYLVVNDEGHQRWYGDIHFK